MKMGILVINKTKNITSHNVVSKIRKKLNIKRVGHTGTLDPLATGVLPICISKATRVSEFIMEQGKTYVATFKFGLETTTYDITGDIVNKSENKFFSKEDIENALNFFKGEILQTPPIYSAIKVDGKKLYDYARSGQDVEIKSRKVTIYDLKLISVEGDEVKIEVSCSKGTYIRSLIHDIGLKLNTYACMTGLVRTRVGRFCIEDAVNIDDLDKLSIEEIERNIIDIGSSLYNLNKISFYDETNLVDRLMAGQKINISKFRNTLEFDKENTEFYKVEVNNKFIGLAKLDGEILKMERVLCE